MITINDFCERLYQNMRRYLQENGSLRELLQDVTSCKALVKACIDIEPDYIVEVDWANETHRAVKLLPYTSIVKFQI